MKYYHYLPISDWGYGLFLRNLLDSIESNFADDNDLSIVYKKISFLLYEKDFDLLVDELKDRFSKLKNKTENYRKELSKLFASINIDSLIDYLKYDDENISIDNRFELFDFVYKINFNIFSDENFLKKVLEENILPLYFILQHEKLVNHCSSFFHDFLLKNPETLELFIDEVDVKNDCKIKRFFPSFTNNEINSWIEKYLDLKICNLNYLHVICLHKDGDHYSLNAKTLVKVKKRVVQIEQELSKNGVFHSNNFSVSFEDDQEDSILYKRSGNKEDITLSSKWINNNKDYPTLLNNLIYVINICDEQMRINETYNKNNDGAIYSAMTTRHNNEYGSYPFQVTQSRRQLIFNSYVSNLFIHWKIKIEEIYKWFVEVYLKDEFNIEGMTLNFDFSSSDYASKCRNVFTLIDRLLKQYSVYVDNETFSSDLFVATKKKYKIDSIPSLNKNKYYYINTESNISYILFLLFSNQSMINYINEDLNEDNFAILIYKHKIKYSEFPEYDKSKLDLLLKSRVIILRDNYLSFRSNYLCSYINFIQRDLLILGIFQQMKKKLLKNYLMIIFFAFLHLSFLMMKLIFFHTF